MRQVIVVLLLLVVALAPLPLASNRDWAWAPLSIVVGVMLLTFAVYLAMNPGRRIGSRALTLCGIALAAVVTWAALQTTSWLSLGQVSSTFATLGEALGHVPPDRISIETERTWTGLMRLGTYGAIFWLAVQLCAERGVARLLCRTVLSSAVLVTVYGWIMQITVRSCIAVTFIKRPLESGDPCSFSGTFVNSGNYATYAGLASLVCVAELHVLLLEGADSSAGTRSRWARLLTMLSGRGALYLGILVLLLSSLIFSASRAGAFAFLVAASVMTMSLGAFQKRGRSNVFWSLFWVLTFIVAIIAISGRGLISRSFSLLVEGDSDRIALFELTWRAIALRPWTGWGLGSFDALYSIFQSPRLLVSFDKAHNAYLETILDLGFPAASLLLVILLTATVRCFKGMRDRSRDAQYPAIGFGCSVFVGLHSLVDFGIQIPAVAVTYMALLGLGWSQSQSSRSTSSN